MTIKVILTHFLKCDKTNMSTPVFLRLLMMTLTKTAQAYVVDCFSTGSGRDYITRVSNTKSERVGLNKN